MTAPEEAPAGVPLYPRLLGLRRLRPNAWQRAALGEGVLLLSVLLVLADLASAWTLIVLPAAVGAVVKLNDLVVGWLADVPRPEVSSGGR